MSKRKYRFKKMSQEQLETLGEKFPKAVQTITTRKPVYSMLAKLCDCGVEVPGLEMADDAQKGDEK